MADKYIRDLTAAGSISTSDLFEIETSGGNSRKVTGQTILDFANANGVGGLVMVEPSAADFGTLRNGMTSAPTLTDPSGQNGVLMQSTRQASRQHAFELKSAGLSAPYTVEAAVYAQFDVDDPFWWGGIAIGDTSANQHAFMSFACNGVGAVAPAIECGYVNSLTASDSGTILPVAANFFAWALFRLVNDGTNITGYWSPDGQGKHWHKVGSITISGNFTNGATMVGLHQGHVASTGTNKLWCPHFKVS